MKDKVQFVLIVLLGIVAFILFFGFVLSNIDPNNKLEAYTLAISFVGIFATFGGAYLGALIAGKYTLKTLKLSEDIKREINEEKATQLMENLISITKDMLDRARPQDASGLLLFKERKYKPLNEFYIKEIEKNLEYINDFRLSDNYYYLTKDIMYSLEELYSIVFKLTLNINDLNERNFRNEDEENPVFEIVKQEFYRNLGAFYKKYSSFYKV
ncbi:hypothetical protein [Mammaliicoccus sciuri]|uniref:hypothetical protein n=1 Tax=Mammaliicoccus sciuri TaxID=1296 RepID=UPI002B2622A7|nr:hypothetical protein [Mammaliicoccus sciuri]MEB7768516.1 hypothetical protein [Mammaliicoccus sciuri]MEB7781886.1 hypothetical protein [Mammaliicoccus sciuri]MEB7818827.1 hypothetical protein [Mammaliicoccus sciuri]WQL16937.1 hypothetical protein P3U34_11135 [Mammaliicoccus sciuri]WRY62706.1 hypothetical protein P8F79_11150 [Mammaliicoccus sciuri]